MYSLDELKEIIALLEEHNLTTIKMSDKTNSVCIEKAPATVQPIATPVTAPVSTAVPQAPVQETVNAPATSTGKTIDSPMVGVFYAAPNPDSKPFISVGQTVNKGDVVCIIEAMKIMNEITADESGKVTEVLVKNGDVVEYGQPLFRIG